MARCRARVWVVVVLAGSSACDDRRPAASPPPIQSDGNAVTTAEMPPPASVSADLPATPVALLPPRRFLAVQGKVMLDGKIARAGDAIGETAVIVTGKRSSAVVILAPDTFFELRAGSRLRLGSSPRKRMSLHLLAGALWSFVAPDSSYEVVTANAIAGVRGTTFFVDAKGKHTYLCACDGRLELRAGGDKVLPRNIESHNDHIGIAIRSKGKRAKTHKAARRGHTDQQAAKLRGIFDKAAAQAP